MKTLVLGASGATGKLVVSELTKRNKDVRALLRATATYPEEWKNEANLEIVTGNIHELSVGRIAELLAGCDSVISCLGHTVSFKGLFGKPGKLVFDSVKKVFEAAEIQGKPIKFVLMSTTAYTNMKEGERNTAAEGAVLSLLKQLLPPHSDNMAAADYLVYREYETPLVEWVAVRPDTLVNATEASPISAVDTKQRSAVFDPGKTSRINVACFMRDLVTDGTVWDRWRFRTPVLYDRD